MYSGGPEFWNRKNHTTRTNPHIKAHIWLKKVAHPASVPKIIDNVDVLRAQLLTKLKAKDEHGEFNGKDCIGRNHILRSFNKIHRGPGTTLDFIEFKKGLEEFSIHASDSVLRALFNQYDHCKTGKIDFVEFVYRLDQSNSHDNLDFVKAKLQDFERENPGMMLASFQAFSRNGTITPVDMRRALLSLNIGMKEWHFSALLENAEKVKGGMIVFEDFMEKYVLPSKKTESSARQIELRQPEGVTSILPIFSEMSFPPTERTVHKRGRGMHSLAFAGAVSSAKHSLEPTTIKAEADSGMQNLLLSSSGFSPASNSFRRGNGLVTMAFPHPSSANPAFISTPPAPLESLNSSKLFETTGFDRTRSAPTTYRRGHGVFTLTSPTTIPDDENCQVLFPGRPVTGTPIALPKREQMSFSPERPKAPNSASTRAPSNRSSRLMLSPESIPSREPSRNRQIQAQLGIQLAQPNGSKLNDTPSNDFLTICSSMMHSFLGLDVERTGKVSSQRFRSVLVHHHFERFISNEELSTLLSTKTDIEEAGTIDYMNFLKYLKQLKK